MPVTDTDLKLAREIAAENISRTEYYWDEIQGGKADDHPAVQSALAALEAGRKAGLEEGAKVAGNTPIDVEAIWRAVRNIPTEGDKRLHQHFTTGNAKVNFCHEIATAIRKLIEG